MWFSVGCTPIDNEYASLQWTKRKNVWEKSNDAYSLLIRVQTTLSHILTCFFYHNINIKENVFFRARAEKGIARHTDASSVVWTLIDNGKLANQIARSRLAAIVVK